LYLQYLFASFDDGKQIQYRYAATQALLFLVPIVQLTAEALRLFVSILMQRRCEMHTSLHLNAFKSRSNALRTLCIPSPKHVFTSSTETCQITVFHCKTG